MFKKGNHAGDLCPLLRKTCVQDKCMWWTQVRGRHPQSGEEIDQFGCAVAWMPILQIEQASETRGAQSAVESFRNDVAATVQMLRPNTRGMIENEKKLLNEIGPLKGVVVNKRKANREET